MQEEEIKYYTNLGLRYFSLIVFMIIFTFHFLFELISKLTIYTTYFLISLFSQAYLNENIINFNNVNLLISRACLGISGYIFIIFIVFTTPMKTFFKNVKIYFLASFLFFLLNIFRILFLAFLLNYNESLFEKFHFLFYFGVTSFLLFIIVIFLFKVFEIKTIPVISDIYHFNTIILKKKN